MGIGTAMPHGEGGGGMAAACRCARLGKSVEVPSVNELADAQRHQAEADQDSRLQVGLRRRCMAASRPAQSVIPHSSAYSPLPTSRTPAHETDQLMAHSGSALAVLSACQAVRDRRLTIAIPPIRRTDQQFFLHVNDDLLAEALYIARSVVLVVGGVVPRCGGIEFGDIAVISA